MQLHDFHSHFLVAVEVLFQQGTLYSVPEGSTMQICVQLSREAAIQVIIPVIIVAGTAQQNVDFTISSQSFTFPAGIQESCNTVSSIGDTILEDDEQFTLTLQSSDTVVSLSDASITIIDQNSTLSKNMQ